MLPFGWDAQVRAKALRFGESLRLSIRGSQRHVLRGVADRNQRRRGKHLRGDKHRRDQVLGSQRVW